jgi:hypothetical protein
LPFEAKGIEPYGIPDYSSADVVSNANDILTFFTALMKGEKLHKET